MAIRTFAIALSLLVSSVSIANAQTLGPGGINGIAAGVPGLPASCAFIGTDNRGYARCVSGGGGGALSTANEIAPLATGTLAVTFDQVEPPYVGFWTDTDNNPNINVMRLRERLFVGDCVGMGNSRASGSNNDTWIPNSTVGANWIPRDSQNCTMQDRGGIAVSGLVRSSDGENVPSPPPPIGVAAFVINDGVTRNTSVWGLYSEVQHQPDVSGVARFSQSMSLECDTKNKTTYNATPNPFVHVGGTYCLWLAAGGDSSYGGASVNPSTAAIQILHNSGGGNLNRWNAGIVFEAQALVGTDGIDGTGTADAIMMPIGQRIVWEHTPNPLIVGQNQSVSSYIVSRGITNNDDVGIIFGDNFINFANHDQVHHFLQLIHTTGAVNGLEIATGIAGTPVHVWPNVHAEPNSALWLTGARGSGGVLITNGTTESASTFSVKNIAQDTVGLNVDMFHTNSGGVYTPILSAPYAAQVGGAGTSMNIGPGELGLFIGTASGINAGSHGLKIYAACGTNPGTTKLVAVGGSNTLPYTIIDNMGVLVAGC